MRSPGEVPPRPREGIIILAIVLSLLALIVGIIAIVALLRDRGEVERVAATPVPTATPSPLVTQPGVGVALPFGWTECTNTAHSYVIGYPQDWHTDATDPVNTCRWFDREPFDVPPDGEAPLTDMSVVPGEAGFDQLVAGFTDSPTEEVVASRTADADGSAAVVIETVATGEGLYPEGTRTYAYVIGRAGTGFIVQTVVPPGEGDFEENLRVVDTAVQTLRLG